METRESRRRLDWPLCCRYLIVHFKTFSMHVQTERDCTLQWAFGALADGRSEVLGAWLNPGASVEAWKAVFDSLKARGVEGIRFLASEEQSGLQPALDAAYPSTKVLHSTEPLTEPARSGLGRSDGELGFDGQDLLALWSETPVRSRRVLQQCDVVVNQLHTRLSRSVVRHPCFAGDDDVASLVVEVLERAERRLGVIAGKQGTFSHRTEGTSTRSTRRIGASQTSRLSA